jgi:polyhydroxyalkanoate synthesis regulator phasin
MHIFNTAIKYFSFFLGVCFVLQMSHPGMVHGQDKELQVQSDHELLISYQGRLTDADGKSVSDGNHTVVFSSHDQESGVAVLWYEIQNLETSNGIFSAYLGAVNSIDTLTFNRPFYLGIQVDGGDELSPRTRLTTVPYAQRAHSIDDSTVTSEKLTVQAVAEQNIEDRAVTTNKLDYMAVDSARLDPDAVFKTLRPELLVNRSEDFVGVNRTSPITGNEFFSVDALVGNDVFGGMYVNTEEAEGWPFYGYAGAGDAHAWHLFDPGENEWVLEFDFTSPRFRLRVTEGGVLPGGDGDIKLGNASHRWSEVYAANGTIQTSDRRLKTGIRKVEYGLEEILKLNPVEYRWKKEAGDNNGEAEPHLGLIAQDVQNVIAEVVEEPKKEDGYLGMNYSELVPVLIKAVQEQQKQIRELQRKLDKSEADRKAELEALKERVNRLAKKVQEGNIDDSGLTSVER